MSKQANSTIQPSKRHGKLQAIWNWLRENGPVLVALLAIGGTLKYSMGIDSELIRKDIEILRTQMQTGFQLVDLRFQAVEDNIDDIEVDIKEIKQDIRVLQRDVGQIKGRLAVSLDDEPHFAESDADP